MEKWPIRSAGEVAAHARENVNKFQRKAFSGALTRPQARRSQKKEDQRGTQEIPKSETQKGKPVENPTLILKGSPLAGLKIL